MISTNWNGAAIREIVAYRDEREEIDALERKIRGIVEDFLWPYITQRKGREEQTPTLESRLNETLSSKEKRRVGGLQGYLEIAADQFMQTGISGYYIAHRVGCLHQTQVDEGNRHLFTVFVLEEENREDFAILTSVVKDALRMHLPSLFWDEEELDLKWRESFYKHKNLRIESFLEDFKQPMNIRNFCGNLICSNFQEDLLEDDDEDDIVVEVGDLVEVFEV